MPSGTIRGTSWTDTTKLACLHPKNIHSLISRKHSIGRKLRDPTSITHHPGKKQFLNPITPHASYQGSRAHTIPYTTTKTTSLHDPIPHQARCHKPGTQVRQRLSQHELPPTTSTTIQPPSGLFNLRKKTRLPVLARAARLSVHFAVPGTFVALPSVGLAVCHICWNEGRRRKGKGLGRKISRS